MRLILKHCTTLYLVKFAVLLKTASFYCLGLHNLTFCFIHVDETMLNQQSNPFNYH